MVAIIICKQDFYFKATSNSSISSVLEDWVQVWG